MLKKEDIIARLQEGDSIDTIADEITATINEAKEEYTKREQEEKEAEDKKLRLQEAKLRAAEGIIDGLCDYACASRDDKALEMFRGFTPGGMVKALDDTIGFFNAMADLEDVFGATTSQKEVDKSKVDSLLDVIFGKR